MLEKVEIFWQLLTIFDNVDTILTDSWHHVVNMLPMLTFHSTIMLRQLDLIPHLLCRNRKTWPKDGLTKWVYEMLARLKTNTVLVSFQNARMLPCSSNGLFEQSCLKPACSKTRLNDWPALFSRAAAKGKVKYSSQYIVLEKVKYFPEYF